MDLNKIMNKDGRNKKFGKISDGSFVGRSGPRAPPSPRSAHVASIERLTKNHPAGEKPLGLAFYVSDLNVPSSRSRSRSVRAQKERFSPYTTLSPKPSKTTKLLHRSMSPSTSLYGTDPATLDVDKIATHKHTQDFAIEVKTVTSEPHSNSLHSGATHVEQYELRNTFPEDYIRAAASPADGHSSISDHLPTPKTASEAHFSADVADASICETCSGTLRPTQPCLRAYLGEESRPYLIASPEGKKDQPVVVKAEVEVDELLEDPLLSPASTQRRSVKTCSETSRRPAVLPFRRLSSPPGIHAASSMDSRSQTRPDISKPVRQCLRAAHKEEPRHNLALPPATVIDLPFKVKPWKCPLEDQFSRTCGHIMRFDGEDKRFLRTVIELHEWDKHKVPPRGYSNYQRKPCQWQDCKSIAALSGSQYIKHLIDAHLQPDLYRCSRCEACFVVKDAAKRHVKPDGGCNNIPILERNAFFA